MPKSSRDEFLEFLHEEMPSEDGGPPKKNLIHGFCGMVVLAFVFGLPIMLLWNHFITDFLPMVGKMSYLDAVAVFALSSMVR